MKNTVYQQAAAAIHNARVECLPLSEVTEFDCFTIEDGYGVQRQLIKQMVSEGKALSGWKVAMANQPALDRFGLEEPVYGVLFSDMLIEGDSLSSDAVIAPKLEAELAFILGHDLEGDVYTDQQIIEAIAWIAPAFEIADSRLGWTFSIGGFVADNAVASFYQLGELQPFIPGQTATEVECSLTTATETLSGSPASVLGGPLNSFIKMVRSLLALHGRVEAGQHFISGSLTKPIDMIPGTTYRLTMLGGELVLSYK
ncbi:MAG: 2-keto-4-pentenoate hydratase [Oceanospirillales bacterium]|nr:2-keto-4-pentenoate hydratase [Oceanospirillales bacterium]MBR9888725.1 2-keto-4-pentenoate hydratase [Oceanospirillales bacterium]